MEIVAKDRLSQYKSVNPPVEEAVDFIKDVWELNMNLELNDYYFKSQLEENSIQNDNLKFYIVICCSLLRLL